MRMSSCELVSFSICEYWSGIWVAILFVD
jgi:hypothetical protein